MTERRFQKAKPILDRYRDRLMKTQRLDTVMFEKELREVWGLHYQALKTVMIDLAARLEYVYLAARYMEGGFPGVISEFQAPLAKLYGIAWYYDADRDQKQTEFWEKAFDPEKAA